MTESQWDAASPDARRAWCAANGKHYCEPGNPWSPDKSDRAVHPEAREVGDQQDGYPGGDTVKMHCPVCNHTWTRELPQ